MSVDITTLVLEVRSQGVEQAATSLNKLADASDRAESSSTNLGNTSKKTNSAYADGVIAADKLLATYQKQVDLLGSNISQQNAYNVALKGGNASQVLVAQQLGAQQDAYKRLAADQAEAIRMNKAMEASLKNVGSAAGHASSGTSGIFRELLVLGHEASQGQFTRLGGSFIVLAERADVAGKSVAYVTARAAELGTTIGTILAPILAVVAALTAAGIVLYNFYKSAQNYHELNNALLLTNNYAGASADSLLAMARAATVAGGSVGHAKEAVLELAMSGKFTAEQIQYITEASIALEHATGISTKDTIKHFEDLATQSSLSSSRSTDAIAKDALKLNDHYHYLTAGIYEQIVAFEKEGDAQTAISISLQAYAQNVETQAKKIEDSLSGMMKYFHVVRDAASAMWDAISQKDSDAKTKAALQFNLKQFDAPEGGASHVSADAAAKYRTTVAQQIAAIDKRLDAQRTQDEAEQQKQRLEQERIHGQARMNALTDQYDKTEKATKDLAQFDMAWSKQTESYKTAHEEEHAKTRLDIEAKTHEKIKKIRAMGFADLNTEITGIRALLQTQLDSDDQQIKSAQALYTVKKADAITTEQNIAKAIQDKIDRVNEAYVVEQTALAKSASNNKRTATEVMELQGRIATAYKEHEKAITLLNEAMQKNGILAESVLVKAYEDEDNANRKTVDGINQKTALLKAQNEAYLKLPDAIRNAGITDKQMQDNITQAKIDAMNSEIKALEDNADKDNVFTQQKINNSKKIVAALIDERNQQTVREGQQQTNTFNLGFGARAKEEAAMAVQAFNDAGKEISTGFQAIFGDASKPMQDFFTAFTTGLAKQTAAQERYNKVKEAYKDAPEAVKLLKLKEADVRLTAEQTQANLGMYADVAAGAQGFFDKQSTGYKVMGGISAAFHAAEVAMAIASIAPKIAAGAASMFATLGPFGFAAVAGMIAVMAGLGFAGGGSSSAPPTSAVRQAANGTGSVLGDSNAKSDSIQKALDTIAKDSGLGLVHFNSMDNSLKSLVSGISGLSSLLVSGTKLTAPVAATTQGAAANLATNSTFNLVFGGAVGLLVNAVNKITGGIGGKITAAIFGGKTSVEDVGLNIGKGSVGDILQSGANVNQYTDIKKTGGWFSSDKFSTQMQSLGSEINNQFTLVIQSLANTVSSAAKALGIGGDDFTKHLESFVVDIGQISTKGLTGTQIQEALQAAFSKLGDDMAKFAIQGLDKFQKVGEGYLETVARVANDLIQVQDVFAVLGKTMNVTGMAAVDLSEGLIAAFGDITKLTDSTKYFVDNFLTDAEKIAPIQKSLTTELTRLGVATNITTDQYKALVMSQDLSTSSGQQMYAALLNIAPAFKAVENAATSLADSRHKIELSLLDALGNSVDILAAKRKDELDALSKINPALVDLQKNLYAVQDALNNSQNLANKDFSALSKSLQDQKNALQKEYNSQSIVWKQQKDAAKAYYDAFNVTTQASIKKEQSLNTSIGNLANVLDSTLSTLLDDSNISQSRAAAQKEIFDALDKTLATGILPTADALKSSLKTITKPSDSLYSSYVDYAKDLGITAGKVAQLKDLTDNAKSASDLQLETLKASLETAKLQYDATVNGIDLAQQDAKAKLDMQFSQFDVIKDLAQQQLDAMNGVQTVAKSIVDALTAFNSSVVAAISIQQQLGVTAQNGKTPLPGQQTAPQFATTDQITSLYQTVLGREPDAAGLAYWQTQASHGATASQLMQAFMSSSEYVNGSHAGGLDNVPFDGYTAKLHKGEMVLPAKQAKGVAQGEDMAAVVEAVNKLCADNSAENQSLVSDIKFLKKLFQNMTPSGDRLQTYEVGAPT